jgi:thiamine-phosphate pyrophosphorylase
MLLYAVTDRVLLAGREAEGPENPILRLIATAGDWAANGVDFIQVREKDLSVADLTRLAAGIVRAVRQRGGSTKVLVNASPEDAAAVALAAGADGVHLRSGLNREQLAEAVRRTRRGFAGNATVSVSCHSASEIRAARSAGATLALFGPVFEKALPGRRTLPGTGLEALAGACLTGGQPAPEPALPVLALGGVTLANADQCAAAGAAGVAAIRLFLQKGPEREREWRRLSRLRVGGAQLPR